MSRLQQSSTVTCSIGLFGPIDAGSDLQDRATFLYWVRFPLTTRYTTANAPDLSAPVIHEKEQSSLLRPLLPSQETKHD
jgi:hypothetical protein